MQKGHHSFPWRLKNGDYYLEESNGAVLHVTISFLLSGITFNLVPNVMGFSYVQILIEMETDSLEVIFLDKVAIDAKCVLIFEKCLLMPGLKLKVSQAFVCF